MKGIKKVRGKHARLLLLHETLRDQFRASFIEYHRGIAVQMIVRTATAALKRNNARSTLFKARFLNQEAAAIEYEYHYATRSAFFLRQLKRIEKKIDEQN